ncbi:hypothetical protein QJS04_geneDACA018583 [Acorus gramineus]|uniref:Uncharacterized protein n=1 Tax=Acorus gramineus TaxID=55184 RepID=A0AAV9AG12_ACOGR|nr:hypothetical protein QJS04_geneDACA018583 [Acorus gramineus]
MQTNMASDADPDYFDKYMLLRPDKAGMTDLARLLSSRRILENPALDFSEGVEAREMNRRWLIFVSLLVQKLLLLQKRPLALLGSVLEFWLNLLSENRSFMNLLSNLLTGKLILPDRTAATYRTAIGQLDERVDLDEKIKRGDSGYNAQLSIMAAKISYENEAFIRRTVKDHWKMEFVEFYDCWDSK